MPWHPSRMPWHGMLGRGPAMLQQAQYNVEIGEILISMYRPHTSLYLAVSGDLNLSVGWVGLIAQNPPLHFVPFTLQPPQEATSQAAAIQISSTNFFSYVSRENHEKRSNPSLQPREMDDVEQDLKSFVLRLGLAIAPADDPRI
eukprot:Gb_34530 [translate_table: standard]